jgi:hypothetical protein
MQRIKRLRLVVTLKAGGRTWTQGTIVDSSDGPIDQDLLSEVRNQTGTVEVLEWESPSEGGGEGGLVSPTGESSADNPPPLPKKMIIKRK